MPYRAWLLIAALGLVVSPSYAQDEASQSERHADTYEHPAETLPFGFPVRIIEDSESALASERREAEAHENQNRDIIAQERMADASDAMNSATQSMMYAAWVSAFLILLGTGLLWHTLRLTRQANQAAQGATSAAIDGVAASLTMNKMNREVQRARISFATSTQPGQVTVDESGGASFVLWVKNTGPTLANIKRLSVHLGKEGRYAPPNLSLGEEFEYEVTVGPGAVTALMLCDAPKGIGPHFVSATIQYTDVFLDIHRSFLFAKIDAKSRSLKFLAIDGGCPDDD